MAEYNLISNEIENQVTLLNALGHPTIILSCTKTSFPLTVQYRIVIIQNTLWLAFLFLGNPSIFSRITKDFGNHVGRVKIQMIDK